MASQGLEEGGQPPVNRCSGHLSALAVKLLDAVVLNKTSRSDPEKDWGDLCQVDTKEFYESPHISPSVLAGS